MERRTFVILTAVVTLAAFGAADVTAQGQLRGKLTDEWGNPLEGATVVSERSSGGSTTDTTTDDDGEFLFANLSSGGYTFEFRMDGYQAIRTAINVRQLSSNRPVEIELEALPSGSRFRGDTEFEAEGGTPKIKFKEDEMAEFEDAEGEGEATYGIVELSAVVVVRDYDGPDDRYSVAEPVVVMFASDQFTSLTWGEATLRKK